jgi:hypothetical protein
VIGRDFGIALEVLQGLEANDWIVLNPADSLEEGQEVRVKEVTQIPAANAHDAGEGAAPKANKDGAAGAKK